MAGTSPAMTKVKQFGKFLGRHPVHGAKLVAVGIAQIGDVELHPVALTDTRRVLAGRAAMGEAGGVEGVDIQVVPGGDAYSESEFGPTIQ